MIRLNVQKRLRSSQGDLLLDLKLDIHKGQLVTVYGESGAGKTSTLRMLAGLMHPDSGKITVDENVWFDAENNIHLKPQRRNIGFVFQDYALFPNMTVRQNLAFGLEKGQHSSVIDELMEMVELSKLADRRPDTLSGGQKQRVALARALVLRPDILLLDEPLSALDASIRSKLQDHILELHRRYALTTILVSHDMAEIHKLSDHVVVLSEGKVNRQGSPSKVFFGEDVSGKFKLFGEVLHIEPQDVVFVVTVLVHNQMIKVVAQSKDVADLKVGDTVMVASKAFNPIIQKVGR